MKAKVDQTDCIGCGVCTQICPNAFRLNEQGVAEVYTEITADLELSTIEAANACPVSVIEVEI